MLIDKNRKDGKTYETVSIPVRASIAHLDPKLYARLESGDELVTYGDKSNKSDYARFAEILDALKLQKLACADEPEVTPTHLVWVIVEQETVRAAE
jgi:hypothetical protein